jgi:6-phosphogluconolactonase
VPGDRIVVETGEALAEQAAAWIAHALAEAVTARGRATIALAGGTTPRPVYQRLAAEPGVPWDRVEVFFSDERAVPLDHPDSNYRLASESLLSRVPVAPEKVHRMKADQPDLDAAARSYEALLPPSLDLLLLGMGADGHTASLFPHAPSLGEFTRRVVPVTGGEPLVQRLTVTPLVLDAAERILVLVAGAAKAATVARVLEGAFDPEELPAQLARSGTWMMDRAAAGWLPPDEP